MEFFKRIFKKSQAVSNDTKDVAKDHNWSDTIKYRNDAISKQDLHNGLVHIYYEHDTLNDEWIFKLIHSSRVEMTSKLRRVYELLKLNNTRLCYYMEHGATVDPDDSNYSALTHFKTTIRNTHREMGDKLMEHLRDVGFGVKYDEADYARYVKRREEELRKDLTPLS